MLIPSVLIFRVSFEILSEQSGEVITTFQQHVIYPPTPDYPEGRLRLLYEANPVAFIAEQAGGAATDGARPILDIEPRDIHQRTPLVVGGEAEMAEFERCVGGARGSAHH